MAPHLSVRGLLAFASGWLSQSPLSYRPDALESHDTYEPNQRHGAMSGSFGDATLAAAAAAGAPYAPLSGAPSCPIDGPMSCRNNTPAADSCCFLYPGGRVLLTQFWDRAVHAGGTEEDWTLHGLW